MEAGIDRCILRLIASCCNGEDFTLKKLLHTLLQPCHLTICFACSMTIPGDKLVRATELARLLTLEKSLKGAIKLVTALKLPLLAERFNGILEVNNQSVQGTV